MQGQRSSGVIVWSFQRFGEQEEEGGQENSAALLWSRHGGERPGGPAGEGRGYTESV